ncbi:sodium:calcium antiporter [bacterium]|nr:sodium:calcium antiporter [bacterium]
MLKVWIQFSIGAIIIILAGFKLSKYGDIIAEKTGISRAWIGGIFLAVATSLPEFFITCSSIIVVKSPDLAVGNVFGSIIFNLFIIAILDIVQGRGPILREVNLGLILLAGISVILSSIAIAGILIGNMFSVFSVGALSFLIITTYLIGIRLSFRYQNRNKKEKYEKKKYEHISFRKTILEYLFCTGCIFGGSIWVANTAKQIASETGLGETFVGSLFLAAVTSLPELMATIGAVRMGLFDMAIGTILGSNMLNIALIPTGDILYRTGSIYAYLSSTHILTAVAGVLLTMIVIVGIIYRSKKSFLKLGWDAIAIIVVYIASTYMVFRLR